MRHFASCFGDYAVRVSDTSCSGHSTSSCISPAPPTTTASSVQNAVVCRYSLSLSSGKRLLVTVTWTRTALSHGLAVAFNGDASSAFRLSTNSRRIFRKPRGSKTIAFQSHTVEVLWDLSSARFGPGPEPVDGFYVFLTVDSEIGPTIGNMAREAAAARRPEAPAAQSALISRQEYFSGSSAGAYGTRARFCDAGPSHEVSIRCDGGGGEHPALSVFIDEKAAMRVKRLRWNFRGNQTILVDGVLVDMMWDVHDWFYDPVGPGHAVFMFRTRSGRTDSRLWLEEEKTAARKDQDIVDFSLMIYACKKL